MIIIFPNNIRKSVHSENEHHEEGMGQEYLCTFLFSIKYKIDEKRYTYVCCIELIL